MYIIVCSVACCADWLTFNHDPQRTGWASEETKLNARSVGWLELKWSAHLDNAPLALNALTAPVVANGIVYVAGSSNRMFALNAATGEPIWDRVLPTEVISKQKPDFLCPNALNATPVIDQGRKLIYVLGVDGRLFGLDLASGVTKFGPVQFTPAYAKPWSLNQLGDYVFTTTSQYCANNPSAIYSIKVTDPSHTVTYAAVTQHGSGSGLWSRGGATISATGKLYVSTGDGPFDPSAHSYGNAFLRYRSPQLELEDYYSPENWNELRKRDLDLPSGGLVAFSNLIAGGGKDGVLYLLDVNSPGGAKHSTPLYQSPRMGNEEHALEGRGFWGSPAYWRDETGQAWLFVPLWGEPSAAAQKAPMQNGPAPHGSILAFRVESNSVRTELTWISEDISLPDPPVVANGVVFVVATGENAKQNKDAKDRPRGEHDWHEDLLTTEQRGQGAQPQALLALDAKTGKTLYRNNAAMKTWNHFGGLAIDNGQIFAVDHSSTIYCFGIKNH